MASNTKLARMFVEAKARFSLRERIQLLQKKLAELDKQLDELDGVTSERVEALEQKCEKTKTELAQAMAKQVMRDRAAEIEGMVAEQLRAQSPELVLSLEQETLQIGEQYTELDKQKTKDIANVHQDAVKQRTAWETGRASTQFELTAAETIRDVTQADDAARYRAINQEQPGGISNKQTKNAAKAVQTLLQAKVASDHVRGNVAGLEEVRTKLRSLSTENESNRDQPEM
jgi:hypothetical protein